MIPLHASAFHDMGDSMAGLAVFQQLFHLAQQQGCRDIFGIPGLPDMSRPPAVKRKRIDSHAQQASMQSLRNKKEIQNLHIFLSVETESVDFRRLFGTKIQLSAARQESAPHTRLYIIIQKYFELLLITSFFLTAKI